MREAEPLPLPDVLRREERKRLLEPLPQDHRAVFRCHVVSEGFELPGLQLFRSWREKIPIVC